MRNASFRNKKASVTNFFVTEAVKNFIAVPLRFIAHQVRKNPAPLTVAFRKTILACSKKSAFPFRAHRVHFTVLRQVNSQRLFTSLVSGFSGYFSRSSHL